jgi:hypothetical protein
MYWAKCQINLVMNQNKNTDSAITSKAKKRCAVNRKISEILSVIFFLQLIATPFKIYTCQALQGLTSIGITPLKGLCAEKFCSFLKIMVFQVR